MAKNHAANSSPAPAEQDHEDLEAAGQLAEEPSPVVPAEAPPAPPEPPAQGPVTPPPADPPAAASGSQYEIFYEVRAEGKVKEVGVNVTATSEAEAFDLASKAIEALGDEDRPVTWRYTGRFRKIAA